MLDDCYDVLFEIRSTRDFTRHLGWLLGFPFFDLASDFDLRFPE